MLGQLRKMSVELRDTVRYQLSLSEQLIELNPLIGHCIRLSHNGRIVCIACGKKTSKSFNQGYCYPCFTRLAQCDLCIMKPEICHYAQGTCREPDWGLTFCFQTHIVYLANSSGIKVGITRQTQIPTRWIDQGATQALPIFKTSSRYIAGLIEVAIAQHISDKTSWQKMLKGEAEALDLQMQRDQVIQRCAENLERIKAQFGQDSVEYLTDAETLNINFPVLSYPNKIKSLCLTKTPDIAGVLLGIKGQYLLLDCGVLNIRKYTGYEVECLSVG